MGKKISFFWGFLLERTKKKKKKKKKRQQQLTQIRLNLQSVNRVFIVEPQWNPSVEDQAIARAIRLGQTQQVLVIRYRVKNSIEEVSCSFYEATFLCSTKQLSFADSEVHLL